MHLILQRLLEIKSSTLEKETPRSSVRSVKSTWCLLNNDTGQSRYIIRGTKLNRTTQLVMIYVCNIFGKIGRYYYWFKHFFFLHGMTATPPSPVGQDLLIIKASRSPPDTPQLQKLLWTSDQPDADSCTWQQSTFIRNRQPFPRRDSNSIPASQRPQTHALDRGAIGIGTDSSLLSHNLLLLFVTIY